MFNIFKMDENMIMSLKRKDICDRGGRDSFAILQGQFNVCLAIFESADKSKIVDIRCLKQYCHDTILHICIHFPWVKITPFVHQILAHN